MTLWIFGDEHVLPNNIPEQWMYQVSNHLETKIDSLAAKGTALEFTYQRFNLARKKISYNDVVVVSLTNFDRRWFFKHYPEAAITDQSPTDNKKENKAISLYRKYLDHKEIHRTYLMDFLYNLYALTDEQALHTIVLPASDDIAQFLDDKSDLFPLFHIAKGCLDNVASKSDDANLNYLTAEAHDTLYRKIIDNIKNNSVIDLTQGV